MQRVNRRIIFFISAFLIVFAVQLIVCNALNFTFFYSDDMYSFYGAINYILLVTELIILFVLAISFFACIKRNKPRAVIILAAIIVLSLLYSYSFQLNGKKGMVSIIPATVVDKDIDNNIIYVENRGSRYTLYCTDIEVQYIKTGKTYLSMRYMFYGKDNRTGYLSAINSE